jgi:acetyltransferase-like isoleucine patch superfamily enzyme
VPPDIAPGAFVADGAHLDDSVIVEPGAVIPTGVRLGPECLVEAGAVVGKRPRLRPGSSAGIHGEELGPLVLGEAVTVCAGAVVYAGSWIGDRAIIGDQVQLRERSRIGAGTVVGRGSTVDFQSVIGERVRIQTSVYLTGGMVVEDDVFLGPGVVTTNDQTMGRHRPGEGLLGPVLRRACRVGGGAVLVPGVEIGEEAFVAAGSVVTRDVAPRQVVMGVPARVVREVPDADLIERWK